MVYGTEARAEDTNSGGVYIDPSLVSPSSCAKYLSENNLRFTGDSDVTTNSGYANVNTSVSSGKWYWEVEMLGNPSAFGINTEIGGQWIAIMSNGGMIFSGQSKSYGSSFAKGDVMGILLDTDNGKIEFTKNGVSEGVITVNKETFGHTFRPFLSINFPNFDVRFNFGATAFKYANKIPSGYLPYSLSEPIKLVADAGDNQVNLKWNSIAGATGYNIYRSDKSGGPYTTPLNANPITSTTYTDSSVKNDSTYYYIVRAVANGAEAMNSNEVSVTPKSNIVYTGNKAILEITMTNGTIKEYDLTMDEIDKFLTWYDNRSDGAGKSYYRIIKRSNVKPFNSRYEYLQFDKIYSFEVKDYNDK
ncbi:SPRY domain-containing protein [Anaeromicropila herbilytica]|uniref:Fibronectin type-III domain-containing protein n=1 Tax=Anaeromicropila herbilytica TaxID=2785025 RepID=A0A7R7IEG7_9FIRM|nr:SPRY domain-containing protein [Anaeromicropila herbilytica]BCN32089.1 hypothetical protein bsdtb5_33840 [Anaeromicropila herbilytica]